MILSIIFLFSLSKIFLLSKKVTYLTLFLKFLIFTPFHSSFLVFKHDSSLLMIVILMMIMNIIVLMIFFFEWYKYVSWLTVWRLCSLTTKNNNLIFKAFYLVEWVFVVWKIGFLGKLYDALTRLLFELPFAFIIALLKYQVT